MKITTLLREGLGRSSNIFRDFFRDIVSLPNVEKLVKDHAINDGHAFLLRGKDGNAYEVIIRPAQYAQFFQDERKADQFQQRKEKEAEKRRQRFGL
jgi:hypothetical protein